MAVQDQRAAFLREGEDRRGVGPYSLRPTASSLRLPWAVVAGLSATVLAIARILHPASGGQGTHEQLGLPPCTFHELTGHGCPGCGLTTAFAHLARGHLGAAFDANPIGVLLFAAVALSIPLSLYRLARPKPIDDLLTSRWPMISMVGLFSLMMLTWVVRLALGLV
jgi:hypothetical protein